MPIFKRIGRPVSKEVLDLKKVGKINGWIPSIPSEILYRDNNTFTFLSQSHTFKGDLDWDFKDNGLLWAYNLNYFEFLEQPDTDVVRGCTLIDNFLRQYPKLKVGHDPYPISLRLMFWIRFFIRQDKLPAGKYLVALHEQAKELQAKLEYHLLGNHLLENAYALFFTGAYLGDTTMTQQAKKLLQKQLDEQILEDGGHFELSPMYHQLMLYRLLDVVNMGRACITGIAKDILPFLERKASMMLGWMQQMCFADGTFPLLNDAAYGIAPEPVVITAYAGRLNIMPRLQPLSQSGYRKWTGSNWEMIMDVGRPGPSYQPGHAHCDALSFILQVNNKPLLVDTGTSVYGSDAERRMIERSTSSHNTVQINNIEQSEIWGDFRMARQAMIHIKKESSTGIEAVMRGFYPPNANHIRKFRRLNDTSFNIEDEIYNVHGTGTSLAKAYLHFGSSIEVKIFSNDRIEFDEGEIIFNGAKSIEKKIYYFAPNFGKLLPSSKVEIAFLSRLVTIVKLKGKRESI